MEGKPSEDVASLFSRARLGGTGRYKEFASKRVSGWRVEHLDATPAELAVVSSAATSGAAQPIATRASAPSAVLESVLGAQTGPIHSSQHPTTATMIALFSLAGGVGRTTIATTLGRVLSECNRKVVLANGSSEYALQHLLGARSQKVGPFTFLAPPVGISALAQTIVEMGGMHSTAEREDALKSLAQVSLHADIALLDLAPCSAASNIRLLREADHLLIPISPDMHSAMTINSLENLVRSERPSGSQAYYILNRYDPSREPHREVRSRLQDILGAALLPFFIREEACVQDAMSHGVTVADYAPDSEVVSDFMALGKWAEQLEPRPYFLKGVHA